ncbi:MAG: hypothetical protein C4523_09855 [Myxococcales bacterium]|nr:MAG: hypothetical protein C4523_09855 [Myxococcales bacterium]
MLRSPVLCFIGLVTVLVLTPLSAFAEANIDVYQVEVEGDEVDLESIYVREDSVIKLSFRYDASSNTTVDNWQLWIGQELSGVLYDQGEFSGKTATVSFTTKDLKAKETGGGTTGRGTIGDGPYYSYSVTVKVNYTEGNNNNNTDGDTDDESFIDGDSDDDERVVNNDPTQSVTINVDEDPPAKMVLDDNPIPGENALTVSWTPVTTSESNNPETEVFATFCVRRTDGADSDGDVDGDVDLDRSESAEAALAAGDDVALYEALPLQAGDEDEETEEEASDGEEDVAVDGDEEAAADGDDDVATEGEEDTATDGDAPIEDGDAEPELSEDEEETADGDAADGDISDGDETVDGDAEEGDGPTSEELPGCTIYAANGASGESYRITDLENDVRYEIRAKAIDAAGNKSLKWSEPIYGTPRQVDDFWEFYKRNGGKEDGGFCFIATAAYGAYDAKDVQLLRRFRDDVLAGSPLGRRFIAFYYLHSPALAKRIAQSPVLAWSVRQALAPAVLALRVAYEWNWATRMLLLSGAFVTLAGVGLILRRKEARP